MGGMEGWKSSAMDCAEEEPKPEEVTFPLLSLPNVVIHHLAGYLDPESTFFLGATCLSLGKIISKRVLARNAAILSDTIGGVATLAKDLVQAATILISCGPESDQDKWRLMLIHQITTRFPSKEKEYYVALDCPKCDIEKPEVQINSPSVQEKTGLVGDEDHVVNWTGFLLLVEVFKGLSNCDLLPVAKVKLATGLLRVAGYVALQTKPVQKLTINEIHCETAVDGAACTALLQRCETWNVDTFRMTGNLGEPFWEGMATATTIHPEEGGEKENLQSVRVTKKVLKRGRREHVRKVCQATKKACWNVYAGEFTENKGKGEKREEGWSIVERVLDTA